MRSDARCSTGEVSENAAKAPNRCKKEASGGADTKQMLLLRVLPPPLRVCAKKRGAVIWSVFCWSIQPWEVSKPSDLIRAGRVPGAEWRIDLPITWQRASIKRRLFTWRQRNEQGETNKDGQAQRSEADEIPGRLTNKTTQSRGISAEGEAKALVLLSLNY